MTPIRFFVLVAALLGCEDSRLVAGTDVPCVGVAADPDPDYRYEVSVRNAVLGVLFAETVFAPVIWLAADFYCPTGPAR